MRVPACTVHPEAWPQSGQRHRCSEGDGYFCAQESKNCGLPSEDSEDSRLETLNTLVEALDPPAHGRNQGTEPSGPH